MVLRKLHFAISFVFIEIVASFSEFLSISLTFLILLYMLKAPRFRIETDYRILPQLLVGLLTLVVLEGLYVIMESDRVLAEVERDLANRKPTLADVADRAGSGVRSS